MRTFGKDELEWFLGAVDQALTHPTDVIVIGGTAAALHYGVPGGADTGVIRRIGPRSSAR